MAEYVVQVLNRLAEKGLQRFSSSSYRLHENPSAPDAILLRSYNLHDAPLADSLLAVARAGVGVNNIPVDLLSNKAVVVFNTPGANANAVKELVLAGMLLASRHLCAAWDFVRNLHGTDDDIAVQVETHKKDFAGFELAGHTLGVIGLGAIGVQVANTARALNMSVLGFDPGISVQSAWRLSADIEAAPSLEALLARSDFISLHVPLNDDTRHMINGKRLQQLKPQAVILNFARSAIADEAAVCDALQQGWIRAYVCDFPSRRLQAQKGVIALPHLGASTAEAEENCAVMAVEQLIDYLEHGNIRNAVNLPNAQLPRASSFRLSIINQNRPGVVADISRILGDHAINIVHMLNESKQALAYTLVDVGSAINPEVLNAIQACSGVLRARVV